MKLSSVMFDGDERYKADDYEDDGDDGLPTSTCYIVPVSMGVCTIIYLSVNMYIYIYMCVCVCCSICVDIYIYTYTYIYIYTHTHT